MNGISFFVTRIYYKGATESHSIQIFTDERQATQRFYNIIAADLADNDVTYQFASIMNSNGAQILPPVIYDRREVPEE